MNMDKLERPDILVLLVMTIVLGVIAGATMNIGTMAVAVVITMVAAAQDVEAGTYYGFKKEKKDK